MTDRRAGNKNVRVVAWLASAHRVWIVARRFLILWSLAAAMYQFVLIDQGLIGFAVIWTLPPVTVAALDVFAPMRKFPHRVVFIYLMLVGMGTWLGLHPTLLPGLGGINQAGTDFAMKWNRLGIMSRRLIAWNMSLTSGLFFWWLGYAVGWLPMKSRTVGPGPIRPAIALLALIVLWGIPALSAIACIPLLF